MDEAEIKPIVPDEVSELQARYDSLSHLVTSMLVLMVVVSGTLSIFLYRQWKMTSKDLGGYRPKAAQFLSDYHRVQAPRIESLLEKLKDYGRTHPDYVPILARYGLSSNAVAGATQPAAKAPPTSAPKK